MNRDQEITQRSNAFREEYRAETPSWYRGEMHLAFTLAFTAGVIWYCAAHIANASWIEWVFVVVPMLLFGNWAEWAGHRYMLHNPKSLLKMAYKRHVTVHHQFFSHKTLNYKGQRDWRALLFPPFAPVLFVFAALPPALLLGWLWSANAGYIAMVTMAAYYLMYEGLHTLSHLKHPLLDRLPLINTVRRMHVLHHNFDFMHTNNFNLTFPICDALFGTSDLNKGVIGTLFHGTSDVARKDDVRAQIEAQKVERAAAANPVAAPSISARSVTAR
ncbi:MAG: sterol desaturase family protein [Burkholderiaceae bacterium]